MNVLKRSASLVTAYLLAVSVFSASPISDIVRLTANAECQTIVNDTFWKDTNGNNIYSQGGGVFQFGDTYYWYGVHYKGAETYAANPSKKNSDTGFVSVTCYSSKDLVNWKFENDVLTSSTKNFGFAYWFGRLGVAYCPNTKRYVLVAQYNESVIYASCDSPTGNFKVENVQDQITDEREKLAADMNGDGNINISDAVMMQRFLLGMD